MTQAGGVQRAAWWDASNDRAMLICRISDPRQADGVSLAAQQFEQARYAERAGLFVVATESFQESAKDSTLRVQFHRALERARREGIKHVVFYVWDRIARNFTDAEMLEASIRSGDVVVHVASGGTVLHREGDDADFFMLDMNIAQAKQDNRGRRRKTIAGMEQRCRNGWYPSRPPTFYRQVPLQDEAGRTKRRGSTIEGPTAEGRRLVRREMELHLRGHSLDRIRATCLDEGLVPSDLVSSYFRTSVEKHLKNPFYAAHADPDAGYRSQFVWRNVTYQGRHEPIFTAKEWADLRASFSERPKYRKRKHAGLFADGPLALACADPKCRCKITYAPKTKPSGTMYRYYRCADGKRVHRERGARQVNVLESDILAQLSAPLAHLVMDVRLATRIAHALNQAHRREADAKVRAAETTRARIDETHSKEDRLFTRLDRGEIDQATYARQLDLARREREALDAALREAQARDIVPEVTPDLVVELARSAGRLCESRRPGDVARLLERVVTNVRLEGRVVRFDVRPPFLQIVDSNGLRDAA